MNDSVTCFMQAVHGEEQVLSRFCLNPAIKKVFLVGSQATYGHIHDKVQHLDAAPIFTGDTIKKIAALSDSEFTLLYTGAGLPETGLMLSNDLSRSAVLPELQCSILITGMKGTELLLTFPLIDYQEGSLRDDFNFGPLLFFRTDIFKQSAKEVSSELRFGAVYELRLAISEDPRYSIFQNHSTLSGKRPSQQWRKDL